MRHVLKNDLPPDLDPLVTTHRAACAYRVTGDMAAQAWTQDEQVAMARAVVLLDRERQFLRRIVRDVVFATCPARRFEALEAEISALIEKAKDPSFFCPTTASGRDGADHNGRGSSAP